MKFTNTLMKHLPEKFLKAIDDLSFYRRKKVSYTDKIDWTQNNSNTSADITDDNINNRTAKFADVINNEKVYRNPLKYFCDLGKINYPVKINFNKTCLLERDMETLFESKKKSAVTGTPDAKIIFTNAPYM